MYRRIIDLGAVDDGEVIGYGHSGYIFAPKLRDFDAELAAGTINEKEIMDQVKAVIKSHLPYKERSTVWIPNQVGLFATLFHGGKYKQLAKIIQKVVKMSAHDRLVRDVSRAIVHAYKVPSKDWVNEAGSVQHFIIHFLRYTFDTQEQFEWPYRILLDWYNGHEGGDCDCLSILYASLMVSLGWRDVRVVLVDSKGDGIISHACAAVKMPKPDTQFGEAWVNVELTRGRGLGTTPLGWLPEKPYTKYKMINVVPGPNENPDGTV
jgi:hypothetical protein